jgi:hypothetical protein
MDLCRVCLFKTEQTSHIFSDAKNGQQIAEVLTNFAPIQVNQASKFANKLSQISAD